MRAIDSIFSKRQKAADPSGAGSGGFSLVELLVAMAIASIVMAAIYSVYASLTRSYTTQNVAADVQQVMRAGIDFMAEDIMIAGLDPTRTADATIEVANSTNIRFTADRNMDGVIEDSNFERITYLYVPAAKRLDQCLYEGTGSADWDTFIDNVTNLTFTYLDANGNDLGNPVPGANLADIRTVVITMTVQEPAGRGGPVNRTYTTRVRCRNIGL
jgi:prepilin-type N-terminal cleavage/methylation domain-containing protein